MKSGRDKPSTGLVLFLWMFLGSCGNDVPDPIPEDLGPEPAIPLIWSECSKENWPRGYPTPGKGVECTEFAVPFDHAQPDDQTFPLRVAREKSTSYPTGKALFFIAGGPGGSAIELSGIIPMYLDSLQQEFDFVYVEQRGTGDSDFLGCSNDPYGEDEWTTCAAQYDGKDLNHYLTLDAAHDLEAARKRLEYDKIYMRGGSYGSRVALEYMRQYENRVAAAILDGVFPATVDFFAHNIVIFDHALERLVDDCRAEQDCTDVSPTLHDDLVARRIDLRENPRPILVGGTEYVEDEAFFLTILRYALYNNVTRYRIPRAVHQAINGDNTFWNGLMSDILGYNVSDGAFEPWSLGEQPIALGVSAAVFCAEYLPNSGGVAYLENLFQQQFWYDPDLFKQKFIEIARACPAWSVEPLSASLRTPVTSTVNTLLLSGELDINTLPEWGVLATESLPNGTHLIVPHATHSTISVPCVRSIMQAFLESDGDMSNVDTSCLQNIEEPAW